MKIELKYSFKRQVSVFLCLAFLVQIVSCGTILYPERQGHQNSGLIDVKVAVLDSIGFIFFIIPGVVAWVVDYNNGALYLPKAKMSSNEEIKFKNVSENNSIEIVKLKLDKLDNTTIQKAILQETGYQIQMDDGRLIKQKAEEGINVERELIRLKLKFYQLKN